MRTSERFCSDSHEICTVLWERKIITCLRAGSACANPRAAPTRLVRARLDRRSARPSSGRLEPKHYRAQTREPPGLRDAAEAGEEAARRRARVLRPVPPPPRPGPAPPLRQQAPGQTRRHAHPLPVQAIRPPPRPSPGLPLFPAAAAPPLVSILLHRPRRPLRLVLATYSSSPYT